MIIKVIESEEMQHHFISNMNVDSCFILIDYKNMASPLSFEYNSSNKHFFITINKLKDRIYPYPNTLEEIIADTCLIPHKMTGLLLDTEGEINVYLYYHCEHLIIHYLFIDNGSDNYILKKVEIALEFPNVQDMPYSHEHEITSDVLKITCGGCIF